MSRLFTAASSEYIRTRPGPLLESTTFGPSTAAFVFRRASDAGWHTLMTFCTSGGTQRTSWSMRGDNNQFQMYDNASATATATTSSTFLNADGWIVIAVTKAAGTVQPTAHYLKLAAGGAWTHETMSVAMPDGSSIGSGGFIELGRWSTGGDYHNGDMAAAAFWPREMSNGECERLAAGLWDRWSPAFHVEFPGSEPPAFARDLGRAGAALVTVSGTSRTAAAKPPGFRYSLGGRRR